MPWGQVSVSTPANRFSDCILSDAETSIISPDLMVFHWTIEDVKRWTGFQLVPYRQTRTNKEPFLFPLSCEPCRSMGQFIAEILPALWHLWCLLPKQQKSKGKCERECQSMTRSVGANIGNNSEYFSGSRSLIVKRTDNPPPNHDHSVTKGRLRLFIDH